MIGRPYRTGTSFAVIRFATWSPGSNKRVVDFSKASAPEYAFKQRRILSFRDPRRITLATIRFANCANAHVYQRGSITLAQV